MRFISTLALALCALVAITCVAQETHTDYDKKTEFSQYHSYYWEKVQTSNPLWQQRIEDAVDKDLQAKGWNRVQSGGEVALTAVGGTHNEQEYQTFYDGLGGWRWGGFGSEATTTVQNYKVGSLLLDMYDAKDKHLIWRGSATDTLSDKPDKDEKKLDKAVDKLLKDFPPKDRG
jgi:hypothetical protein